MELHKKELRNVYSETLVELARNNTDICVCEADLMAATGTAIFKEKFPDRFFNFGVAEANMVAAAAGLSTTGKIPFCSTFTPFLARRAYDQITISVAYAKNNVKLVGTDPGITAGTNGGTHMCFQDLAIMRVMPNMVVLSPADAYELEAAVKWMAKYHGAVYMQLIRDRMPKIFDSSYSFKLGKAVKLTEGNDITIISTGYMTSIVKTIVEKIITQGVSTEHLHYPSIKPFDADSLITSCKKTDKVIVVENQNILGGLGGAVCECLSTTYPAKVVCMGIPDCFGEVGTYDYLLEKHGLSFADIEKKIMEEVTVCAV